MQSHPDADAFMRVYLRNPTDVPTRLVFADWLEETGEPSNVAWAHYIRLKAEAAGHPFGSPDQIELDTEAGGYAWRIRANLTIPATLFVGYPKSLLQLLPAPNITVTLTDFEIPRAVIELMPESVARENVVLPLDLQGNCLILCATHPHNFDLVQKLQFILNKSVVMGRAEQIDIIDAINHHYGQSETESVDSILYEFTDLPQITFDPRMFPTIDDDGPVVRLVNLILREAISLGAERIHLVTTTQGISIRFRIHGRWVNRDPFPRRLLPAVAGRVAFMAGIGASELDRAGRAGGEFRFNYHGTVYTIRAAVEETVTGPSIDLDIGDEVEIAPVGVSLV
jgi:type IV pilus assembly protein PilB